MNDVAIIIPAYNEHENISQLINKINILFPKTSIYIVDDSSNNKTKKTIILKRNIYYFHRKKKLGRGSAVIYGLKKSIKNKSYKIFIEMDADFSHNPNELIKNIKLFRHKQLDLLISSRYLPKSKIINWSFARKTFSISANFLAKILLKIPMSDYTNGFRIYSRRSVKKIITKCGKIGDGFIILSEILLILFLNKFKIYETSSIFVNRVRGESSVNIKLILNSLLGLLKLYIIKINYLIFNKKI